MIMNAEKELLEIYRQFPCRTLPNAYWKTGSVLDQGNLAIVYRPAQKLHSLAVCKDKKV